jgi:ABC-type oligopeptide transport system substrate-binding subunit
MKKVLMVLMAAFLFIGIAACGGTTTTEAPTTAAPTTAAPTTQAPTTAAPTTAAPTTAAPTTDESGNALPVLFGVQDVVVEKDGTFSATAGVSASDAEDGDLTTSIVVTGTVDLTTVGDYPITYTVTDSDGGETVVIRTVTVVAAISYPTGMYNFKFATTELRHTFMAAAEKFLMNNMYGGVPLFANGGFALYSSRLQLPVEEYVPVMGYGTGFGTMTADDSTVLMDDGQPGNAGEYTYRTTISTNPGTWNQWLYDTSTDSDLMGVYMDALYTYQFNDDKTGYAVNPSMADGNPVPVNSETTATGKEVAYTWQIAIKDGLEWYYHPDTVITGLPSGHEVIDATDFVETFKLALDKEWFRAISGGGDFVTSSNAIENAQEYLDGTATWDQVGIKKVDGENKIEFTFVDQQSEWNVRYFLSSFVMTPINIELFELLGGVTDPADPDFDEDGTYGTSNTTIAYHGAYYVDYFEADKILRYKKNPEYHTPTEYFYTGYTFSVIEDSAVRFQEFVAGKLESTSLPTENYDEYKNYPGLRQIPGATTFRMMINGLGTETAQRDAFPGGTWIPEPILANDDFKMAMFFAIDRQKLAEEVLKTSTTQMYLFSDAYLVDPEMGVPYRQTEQGLTVGEGLSPSTFGYNRDAAQAYFELALADLVAAGKYTAGTASAWTVIELGFNIFSGSVAQELLGEYIETTFEDTFQSTEHYIKVDIKVEAKDFPGIYYDYMMTGEFDLSIGGISGSTLDAASFLDVFCDDNRGGFTLNWGIDTSQAVIPVQYVDVNDVARLEMWSFNAITAVLNGKTYIKNGEEADVPSAELDLKSNVAQNATPTSVTFFLDQWNNADYDNITYTVQYYDLADDAYYNYDPAGDGAFIDVDIVTADGNVTITGLEAYYYGYDRNFGVSYRGDYQIVINYKLAVNPTEGASTTSPWFMLPGVTDGIDKDVTPSSALLKAYYSAAFAGDVEAVKVFEYDPVTKAGVEVVGATVTFVDVDVLDVDDEDDDDDVTEVLYTYSKIEVDGLDSNTAYVVEVEFSDGNFEASKITTDPVIVSAVVEDMDGAASILLAALSTEDDITRAVTGFVVEAYVMTVADNPATTEVDEETWAWVAASTEGVVSFDISGNNLFIYAVNLAADSEYRVEFTFDDGNVEYVEFDTIVEEAPAE